MALYLGKDLVSASSGNGTTIKNQDITIKENGTYTAENGYTGFGTVTVDVPTGGGSVSVSPKDVNFYDYDGTILHSYTVAEAQALTELPELPTQKGLICQGWNFDLETIKSYNRAVDVGAMYITDDGKTRLYIRIAAEGRMTVPLYFNQTVANGVTIDWGDGSTTETLSGKGDKNKTHTYARTGNYVITLDVADGCTLALGSSSVYPAIGTSNSNVGVYENMLQKVEIGKGVMNIPKKSFYRCSSLASISIPSSVTSIGDSAFYMCYSLTFVTIPNGVTSIEGNFARSCSSLVSISIPSSATSIGDYCLYESKAIASLVIPNGVTSIGAGTFGYCESLASLVIPNGVTSIGRAAVQYCYSLAYLVIPGSVTDIASNAFWGCASIAIIDFTSHTTVPTLGSNGLQSIPSDCQILVPAALYDEWIAATNWAAYASKIVAR